MRRRWSMVSQVLAAFAVFAVVVGGATIAGYAAVGSQRQATGQLGGRYQVLQHAENVAGHSFRVVYATMLTYTMTGDRGYLQRIQGLQAQVNEAMDTVQARATVDVRGLAQAQAQAAARVFALFPQMMTVRQGTSRAAAVMALASEYASSSATAEATMESRLNARIQGVAASGEHALATGLAWVAAALGVAVLLVLAGSLSMLGAITRPLHRLTATVRRLTAAEFSARAPVGGFSEMREVAQAINVQADEAGRLREQEAEGNRLRAMARAAGIRIREPLAPGDVITEARMVVDHSIGADLACLHLITGGKLMPPAGHEGSLALAGTFNAALPAKTLRSLREMLRGQSSQVVQDVHGPDAGQLPRFARGPLRQAGVVSVVVTPFGVGEELLGVVAAYRCTPGRPWTPAEIDAIESIAADLGRGLAHARTYETLKSLDEAKSDFFATVSHQLRGPLTHVEGQIQRLAGEEPGPVTSAQRHMLDTIGRSVSRLRTLIDDVFTLAKLESGAFTAAVQPVDISEVVRGAVEALRPAAAAGGITLASAIPHRGGLLVDGDPGQLDRVLLNLLSNAVKYTPGGGKIDVTAAGNGSVTVQVTDTGIGIPPADQKHLFTRFYRASNAKAHAIPGTGLGLAIVRTIITSHHGDITLHSHPGQGTTVTIHLPKHTTTTTADGAGLAGADRARVGELQGGTP